MMTTALVSGNIDVDGNVGMMTMARVGLASDNIDDSNQCDGGLDHI